jgi:hypothetical protein
MVDLMVSYKVALKVPFEVVLMVGLLEFLLVEQSVLFSVVEWAVKLVRRWVAKTAVCLDWMGLRWDE